MKKRDPIAKTLINYKHQVVKLKKHKKKFKTKQLKQSLEE